MFTENTYLFSIFLLFFAIIIIGSKLKSSSDSHKRNASSTKILVINEGKTRDFPSKVVSYLQKHATIELKDLKNIQVEDLRGELENYNKIILVCKIGERMELHQEKIIRELSQQIQRDLKVFYLLNQGSGSYHVIGRQDQEVNVFLHEVNEKILEKSLKDFVDVMTDEKSINQIRLILLLLGLLCIASITGCLQSRSAGGEEDYSKLQVKDEELEKMREELSQFSQKYDDLLRVHKRLSHDYNEMKEILQQNEQDNRAKNQKLTEKQEEIEDLHARILERDESMKVLKEHLVSLNESLASAQNQIREIEQSNGLKYYELENSYHELRLKEKRTRELYEQELEKNKELEKTLDEEQRRHEKSKRKLADSENERERLLLEIKNQKEEITRNLDQSLEDDYKTLRENQKDANFMCRFSLGLQKLVC